MMKAISRLSGKIRLPSTAQYILLVTCSWTLNTKIIIIHQHYAKLGYVGNLYSAVVSILIFNDDILAGILYFLCDPLVSGLNVSLRNLL